MGGPGNTQNPPPKLLTGHTDLCQDWNCVYKDIAAKRAAEEAAAKRAEEPDEEEEEGPSPEEEAAAATKIQSQFRGREGRKRTQEKREEQQAATKIQAQFRGDQGRRKAKARKQARVQPGELDGYRPFVLCNQVRAVIAVGGIGYFEEVTWEDFQAALRREFPTKANFAVYYSTGAAPDDFSLAVKESMVTELHEYRKLQKEFAAVTAARQERERERLQREQEEAERRAAARAERLAARQAAGGDEDEEEEEEDEEPKKPKMTRKEREAFEAAEKARKKEEKERTKREADVEYRHTVLADKLNRFGSLHSICVTYT